MSAFRVLNTGVQPARWNIAVTAALVQLRDRDEIPDTIRFHRYPRSVLLGRHQQAGAVAVDYCARSGIEIGRRVTGGGAVYMSPDILAWDAFFSRNAFASVEQASAVVCGAVAEGLRALGVEAKFAPPNAVTIDGRKISGSSGSLEGKALALQGTVIVALDVAEFAASLNISRASAEENIASLRQCVRRECSVAEVSEILQKSFARALGREAQTGTLMGSEITLADQLLTSEIGRDEFVFGEAESWRRSA